MTLYKQQIKSELRECLCYTTLDDLRITRPFYGKCVNPEQKAAIIFCNYLFITTSTSTNYWNNNDDAQLLIQKHTCARSTYSIE